MVWRLYFCVILCILGLELYFVSSSQAEQDKMSIINITWKKWIPSFLKVDQFGFVRVRFDRIKIGDRPLTLQSAFDLKTYGTENEVFLRMPIGIFQIGDNWVGPVTGIEYCSIEVRESRVTSISILSGYPPRCRCDNLSSNSKIDKPPICQ